MQRVCGYCHAIMGEKCRHCGSLVVVMISVNSGPWQYQCLKQPCRHTWAPGSDPVTTGICEPCFSEHMPKPVAQAA